LPTVNFSLFGNTYSSNRVGVNYGTDGMPGTADDIVYDSGEDGALPVDAIYFLGASDALTFGFDAPFDPTVSDQENIDTLIESFLDPVHPFPQELSTTYDIVGKNGAEYSGVGSIFVPEPEGFGIVLMFAGFLAFVVRKRRVS